MKRSILVLVVVLFGVVGMADAGMFTIGTADYDSDGNGAADIFNLNLIADWRSQNSWATTLGGSLSNIVIDPTHDSLAIDWATGWRLPEVGSNPAPGNQTGNWYATDSELGHLYFVELGNSPTGPFNNSGDFSNLVFDTAVIPAPGASLLTTLSLSLAGLFIVAGTAIIGATTVDSVKRQIGNLLRGGPTEEEKRAGENYRRLINDAKNESTEAHMILEMLNTGLIPEERLVAAWKLIEAEKGVLDEEEETKEPQPRRAEAEKRKVEKPVEKVKDSPFIGSKVGRIFHRPGKVCSQNIQAGNFVGFSSREAAAKRGYKPCRRCKPGQTETKHEREAKGPPAYLGSATGHAFHREECPSVKRIRKEDLIVFDSIKEAKSFGHKKCQQCKP